MAGFANLHLGQPLPAPEPPPLNSVPAMWRSGFKGQLKVRQAHLRFGTESQQGFLFGRVGTTPNAQWEDTKQQNKEQITPHDRFP